MPPLNKKRSIKNFFTKSESSKPAPVPKIPSHHAPTPTASKPTHSTTHRGFGSQWLKKVPSRLFPKVQGSEEERQSEDRPISLLTFLKENANTTQKHGSLEGKEEALACDEQTITTTEPSGISASGPSAYSYGNRPVVPPRSDSLDSDTARSLLSFLGPNPDGRTSAPSSTGTSFEENRRISSPTLPL
jgi:hypothetical protein